ncbi:MAG: hypothetical protein JNL01_00670 [Bdellovibrionales bacterium]|nr:hypothetical protein [Bdellovibrionales bacterium]
MKLIAALIITFSVLGILESPSFAQNSERVCAECIANANAFLNTPIDQPFRSWVTSTVDPVSTVIIHDPSTGLMNFPTTGQVQTNSAWSSELPGTLHAPWMSDNSFQTLTMPVFVTPFYDSRKGFTTAGGLWDTQLGPWL